MFRAVARRSAYLALLNENPAALDRLLTLVADSAWLARQIAEQPLLLDELLDNRVFDTPPSRDELAALLDRVTQGVGAGDVEAMLDAIRVFQRTAIFRIGVADRLGSLPLMKVSDRLTDTAELVLDYSLQARPPRAHGEVRHAALRAAAARSGFRGHRLRQARPASSSATARISISCSCTTRAVRNKRPTAIRRSTTSGSSAVSCSA